MWRGSVHTPEQSTESGKQKSQPTPGRLRLNSMIQTSGPEQIADRLHSCWHHAAIQANDSSHWTMPHLPRSGDPGNVAANVIRFLCLNESCSSASPFQYYYCQQQHSQHRYDRSAYNSLSATRNHMSRGQRTSQPEGESQNVGPNRACSLLKVQESSGRPVAVWDHGKNTTIVKKIAGDSSKRILDSQLSHPWIFWPLFDQRLASDKCL